MDNYQVTVPEGTAGRWAVRRFEVSERDATLSGMRDGYRAVRAGTYTGLFCGGEVIMSDTTAEIRDHLEPIWRAHGHCLINGLGLGVVLQAIASRPAVTKVTVVELDADVIQLVAPHYQAMFGDKLEIVHGDAFTYKPPQGIEYGVVWHDIWPTICTDNLPEMATLHRRYGRRSRWQGSWCKAECQRYRTLYR